MPAHDDANTIPHHVATHGDPRLRRVIASIAFANQTVDDEERRILAASMAEATDLSTEEADAIVSDIASRPDVGELASQVTEPDAIRALIFNILGLAITKHDWEEGEIAAARCAIAGLRLPAEAVPSLVLAFDAMIDLGRRFPPPASAPREAQ